MELDINLSNIKDIIELGIILLDNDFNIIDKNAYAEKIFKDLNKSLFEYFICDKQYNNQFKNLKEIIINVINKQTTVKNIPCFVNNNNSKKHFNICVQPLIQKENQYIFISIKENIEKDIEISNQEKFSKYNLMDLSRLKNYIENANGAYFMFDDKLNILETSDSSVLMTGYSKTELKKLTLYDITPKYHHKNIDDVLNCLKQKSNCGTEIQYIKKDNKIRYWNLEFIKISDIEIISYNKDVNDKMVMLEKLQYNSYHDHITGLYNRRYATKILYDFEKNPSYYPISIIVGDINGLKVVNDAFGRFAGDTLIKRTAKIAQDICAKDDFVAKWGGDEFIIISTNSNLDKVQDIISKIKKESEKVNNNIKLSISMGFKIKYNNDENIDEVLKSAENMMFQNKIYEGASFRSQTINIILNTLHEKNKREEQHSIRVSKICVEIGKAMNLSQNDINKLKVIGLLHDIGKIGINETILNKVGKLTDEEFEEIKKHSQIGYRILSSSNQTSEFAQDVLDHHERYDGNGYPKGAPGHKLSTMTKTLTIADSYDAMTSNRPYKNAMTKAEAIEELKRHSSKQFDPYIVDVFINKVLNNPANLI